MSTHNLCFEQEYENIRDFFFQKYFIFGGKIFSMYLNRCVFVMLLHDLMVVLKQTNMKSVYNVITMTT